MKVLTWNCQGDKWGDIARLATQADVVCLQECGAPPYDLKQDGGNSSIYTGTIPFGTRARGMDVFIVYWEAPATRNGIAVLASTDVATGKWGLVPAPSASLRPAVGLEIKHSKTQRVRWVFSVHAPSGNHNAAAGVMHAVVKHALTSNPNAVVTGDFNCSPELLEARGGVYKIAKSGKATRYSSGNELDYLACSNGLNPEFHDNGKVISDHAALVFEVT